MEQMFLLLLCCGLSLSAIIDTVTVVPDMHVDCKGDKNCMESEQARTPRGNCCHNCVSGLNQLQKRFVGLLQPMPQNSACKDPCPNNKDVESDKCEWQCGEPSTTAKAPTTESFIKKHISWPPVWTMDKPIAQCCKTWRIPRPFIRAIHWPPGPVLYPVWCPGFYQLTDHLFCFSRKCIPPKKKICKVARTCRTFLVTHWRPHPQWGHCIYWWLPVWFINYPVPSHCYCAKYKLG